MFIRLLGNFYLTIEQRISKYRFDARIIGKTGEVGEDPALADAELV